MLTEQRYEIILGLLREKNSVTVTELKDILDASESTVRRDITALYKAGKLTRVFGGAVALEHTVNAYEPTVAQKVELNIEEKKKIAAYAAALIRPEDFVYLLATKIKPKHIVVGPNYSFGDKGAGNPAMLTGLCERYGIETEICPEIHEQGVMVSSTVIRGLLASGEVEAAARLLGRPFELSGRVVHGDQRGRSLGFPTANMQPAPQILIPGKGVYAVKVKVGSRYYNGLCNIGTNPTFVQGPLRVETHILDFDREIYGKPITTLFLGRLRAEKTFGSAAELVAQMKRDLQQAQQQYFH